MCTLLSFLDDVYPIMYPHPQGLKFTLDVSANYRGSVLFLGSRILTAPQQVCQGIPIVRTLYFFRWCTSMGSYRKKVTAQIVMRQ